MKVLNVFNTLTLIQIFWKTKTFFKKPEYRVLVETTTTESTSFPFKTALSEANVFYLRNLSFLLVVSLFLTCRLRVFCVKAQLSSLTFQTQSEEHITSNMSFRFKNGRFTKNSAKKKVIN